MARPTFWGDMRATVLVTLGVIIGALVFSSTCSNNSSNAVTTYVGSVTAGDGLVGNPNPITETGTLAVNFSGNGSATTVSRSDHTHDTAYATAGHNHDATYSAIGHNHDSAYSAIGHSHTLGYALVATSENDDGSGNYQDLTTVGPSVNFSLTAAGTVYVEFGASMESGNYSYTTIIVDGSVPSDNDAVREYYGTGSRILQLALAAGNHTITLKYRDDSGGGTFVNRWLRVTK